MRNPLWHGLEIRIASGCFLFFFFFFLVICFTCFGISGSRGFLRVPGEFHPGVVSLLSVGVGIGRWMDLAAEFGELTCFVCAVSWCGNLSKTLKLRDGWTCGGRGMRFYCVGVKVLEQ